MPRPPRIIPPEELLRGYACGAFPMADSRDGAIRWYTANPRAELPLHPYRVPRRLERWLRTEPFRYTTDVAFEAVVRACAERDETWISEGIVRSYVGLHHAGAAHSIEVWEGEELVGGLYGVHLRAAFFGESTFNRVPNAAKAAMVCLLQRLHERDFRLLEIQMITGLTAQFGAREIREPAYSRRLSEALLVQRPW